MARQHHRMGMLAVAFLGLAGASLTSCTGPTITRITANSVGEQRCLRPSVSADGRWVTYTSLDDPSGLTRPQRTSIRPLPSGAPTELAGDPSSASYGGALSAAGGLAVFSIYVRTSSSTGEHRVFSWNRATGARAQVSPTGESNSNPVMSSDGKKVAYVASGGNGIWLADIASKTRKKVTPAPVADNDTFAEPLLSSTGRYVTYRRIDHSQLYVADTVTGARWPLLAASEYGDSTEKVGISGDGRWAAYVKTNASVLGGAPQLYAWDRTTGTSTRLTTAAAGSAMGGAAISGDGARIAYVVPDHGSQTGKVVLVQRSTKATIASISGNHPVAHPVLAADGRSMVFCTSSTNVVAGSPYAPNLYLWRG